MANYTTTADIHAAILFEAGELASGSDFSSEITSLINKVYLAICSGGAEFAPKIHEDWLWLRPAIATREVFNLPIAIDTGTLNITQGATTGTLSSAPAISVAGYHLKIQGESDVYRISAHTAASDTITLDAAFTGSTDTAALYVLFQIDHSFTNEMLRPVSPMITYRSQWVSDNAGNINGIDTKEFNRNFPLSRIIASTPTSFTIMLEADGIFTIRMNGYPNSSAKPIRVECDYLEIPADLTISPDTTPRIPRLHRKVLVDAALYYLWREKADERRAEARRDAEATVFAMARENEAVIQNITHQFGAIYPRSSRVIARDVLRTESGLIIGD